jgi:hypothetical protein
VEPTYSSETSVEFRRTTRCYIPEDRILPRQVCFLVYNNTRCEDELSTPKLLVNKHGLHVKFVMYERETTTFRREGPTTPPNPAWPPTKRCIDGLLSPIVAGRTRL